MTIMTPDQMRAEADRLCEQADAMFSEMYMGNPDNGLIEAMISATYGEAQDLEQRAYEIDGKEN